MDRVSRICPPAVNSVAVDVDFATAAVVAERFVFAVAGVGIGPGFDGCSCSSRIFVCRANYDWEGELVFLG